jgi:hypothetical protein
VTCRSRLAFCKRAASLMVGFNGDGKITGVSLMSMAGD